MGYDLGYKTFYYYIQEKVASYFSNIYKVGSIIDGKETKTSKNSNECFCPAKIAEKLSDVYFATSAEITQSVDSAYQEFHDWSKTKVEVRAEILEKISHYIEDNKFELYSLLIKEGGKSIHDAINETIEAIDFCRYYASQAKLILRDKNLPGPTGEKNILSMHARGVFVCISPWNFPLAIFVGQIVAALVVGNTVIAKPAGQTCVIANFVVKLMHKAGIPKSALQMNYSAASDRVSKQF